jgi:signal transduction histidine kinase/CheY-like chemotaxis protein
MMDRPWILDDLPVGVWVGRVPDGTPAYTNRMFERIMGMPAADVPAGDAAHTYGLVDREGRPYPAEKLPFARVVAARGSVIVDDVVLHRSGGDINIRAFGSPVFEPDGTMSHVIVAFIDITKEVAAEADRRTMEERLLFACNHAPIVIWMTDTQGTVTLSEGAGLASLGVKSGDLVGKNLLELYAAHPTIPGYIRRGLAGESLWYTVEVGEAVYETWVAPLRDSTGKMIAMAALSNDVSQLRKLQRTAIQNDRVMAMGTLAASVAHEINNPLTYVLSHGDALADELDVLDRLLGGDSPNLADVRAAVGRLREGLAPIRTGTNRIAAITRDLRSFSRPDERSLAPVNLRAVVESVLKLVAKEVEARARLVLDLQDTAPVIGNEARLIQVVLNLIVNAYQALPPDSPGYHQVAVSARNDGARVVVEVSDSGPGVPVADRERIFEPFFSTKEIGIGTGLGLFVCRNIVRGFSGEVEVGDRPGGGALFRVALPAVSATALPAAAAASAAPVAKATGAHVILIEDDRLVARAFSLQLGQAGYRVSTYGDGQSGMRALLETNDFDLVFCDLMMTGVTGMDLAEQLAKQAPEKAEKLVLMTGGAFSSRARDFVARHRDRTIDKPFDIVAETQKRLAIRHDSSHK